MLVLGVREGKALRFAGTVGFGVTRRVVAELHPIIEPPTRSTSPFPERPRRMDAIWLEPRVRVELTYAELVNGVLRDPVFRGLVVRSASAPPVR